MDVVDVQEISRAIQARHVAVPIEAAECVQPDDEVARASRWMAKRQFASAPVSVDGRIVGLFAASRGTSRARVEHHMRRLDAGLLVSADTPLTDLAASLVDEPFLFVVQGRRISGFVTPADMGSAPARTHYYLMLAGLEMLLARLVRARFPVQAEAVRLLSEGRQVKLAELVETLRREDEYLDDVAAMYLHDLLEVAKHLPDMRDRATAGGRTWRWLVHGLISFRNSVMHPVRDFAKATPSGMRDLADYDERLLTLMRSTQETLNAGAPAVAPVR